MTHHMLPDFGRDWIEGLSNAFLIRAPEAVLASYARKRPARSASTRSACPPSSPCSNAPPTGSAAPRR